MLLKKSGIKLTELEKECLQAIRDEGSFFEESDGNEGVRENGAAFLGWEIYEDEVKGCRGALASLVKKGVLSTIEDENGIGKPITGYYIHYELEFEEDGWTIKFDKEDDKEDLSEAMRCEANEDALAETTTEKEPKHRLNTLRTYIEGYLPNKEIKVIDKNGLITYEGEVGKLFENRCKTLLNTTVQANDGKTFVLNRSYLPIKIK